MQPLALAALAACLAYVTVDDLRNFRIRNRVVLVLLALSLGRVATLGGAVEIAAQLAFAAAMSAVFLGAYGLGAMGGGDTKLLAVAMLWLGPQGATPFALALLVGAAILVALARLGAVPYRGGGRRRLIPFGPAIAAAWLLAALLAPAA